MRNMSFSMTTDQIRAGTKTVTRRFGWWGLKPGDRVMACEKCMGLKKGEKVTKIRPIEIVSTRRERIDAILNYGWAEGDAEMVREGFPGISPFSLVEFLCESAGKQADDPVNRIEFRYV